MKPAEPAQLRGETPRGNLFCIFGNPLAQSLSPLMHGAAFAKLGIEATYTANLACDAEEVVRRFRQEGLQGASITIPFKETVMPLLDEVDAAASAIGAVNTIVRRDGRLIGYNTDGPGLVNDLEEWMGSAGKTFVLLGAGGAAHAAVYSLIRAGATVTVVNRTLERAQALAARFGCRWAPVEAIWTLSADCLINTTPLGMVPDTGRTPLEAKFLGHFPRIMDMIYHPVRTRLLKEAKASGCETRSGVGMFVNQGAEQLRLWMGVEPPREVMRAAVLDRLGGQDGD
jgi:shikimate dehydrogenase